ncbi:MAG: bifunctional lysylphosphatidylglycerol flippase/synthetase MprF [Candidatus Dormibacteria bacterium]
MDVLGAATAAGQGIGAAAQRVAPSHGPLLLGHELGPVVMGLGLLAAFGGSMRRSRPVLAAATFAILAGAFSFTVPWNPLADWLGLVALAAAVGFEIGGALATGRALDPAGNAGEIERLRLLHGRTHISCFAGEGGKSGLQVGGGVVGYQVRWGVAVAVGDPLTAPGLRKMAVRAFLNLCSGRRWVPCFFQTDATLRQSYRDAGFRVFKFGEEAIVEVSTFDLTSPARADARHELARARRAGLEAVTVWDPQTPASLSAELEQVSRDWLLVRGGREMGFSLGRLRDAVDSTTRYTVAQDRSGRVHAFCSWIRMGEDGIALDLIRRRPDAAAGAVDLCIVTAIERVRSDGVERLSLGSVPFRESLGDAPDGRLARGIRARLYARGAFGYSYRGLSHFKAKFASSWETRDVVLPRGPSSLLALAALIRLHSGTVPPPAAAAPAPPSVPIGLEPAPLP